MAAIAFTCAPAAGFCCLAPQPKNIKVVVDTSVKMQMILNQPFDNNFFTSTYGSFTHHIKILNKTIAVSTTAYSSVQPSHLKNYDSYL
ncbi:hypothetical protein [Pectinatus frisingensis]|jgi:hypothetical protein|uniref:hypothetical protein n=1 Tax=Pectinatus frisingensis TaxID=865 RepID=UPI003D8063FA